VAFGTRLQTGDVGTRSGLREQLAPHRVAVQERGQVAVLLLVGAELEQRRHAHPEPDHELSRRQLETARLLVEHLLVVAVEAGAREVGRVRDPGEPRVAERALKRLRARDGRVLVVVALGARGIGVLLEERTHTDAEALEIRHSFSVFSGMDFADSAHQARLREEVREWRAAHLVGEFARHGGVGGPADDSHWELRLAWERELVAGGWLGITWPREYGGRGGTLDEELVFLEEHFQARAPYWVGVH